MEIGAAVGLAIPLCAASGKLPAKLGQEISEWNEELGAQVRKRGLTCEIARKAATRNSNSLPNRMSLRSAGIPALALAPGRR